MDKEQEYWLREQLKTVSNLTDIAILVINDRRYELLPTVLELMLIEVQDLVSENCIKEDTQ